MLLPLSPSIVAKYSLIMNTIKIFILNNVLLIIKTYIKATREDSLAAPPLRIVVEGSGLYQWNLDYVIFSSVNWGEPERATYCSKAVPRELYIYLCMRTSFRKCPRVVIHRMVSILLN